MFRLFISFYYVCILGNEYNNIVKVELYETSTIVRYSAFLD